MFQSALRMASMDPAPDMTAAAIASMAVIRIGTTV